MKTIGFPGKDLFFKSTLGYRLSNIGYPPKALVIGDSPQASLAIARLNSQLSTPFRVETT